MYRRGGIDSQIEQKKLQHRNSAQSLQQEYANTKNILPLLALQQIAEETKQKEQAMALELDKNSYYQATT